MSDKDEEEEKKGETEEKKKKGHQKQRPGFNAEAYPWASSSETIENRVKQLMETFRFQSSFPQLTAKGKLGKPMVEDSPPKELLKALCMDHELYDETVHKITWESVKRGLVSGDIPIYSVLPKRQEIYSTGVSTGMTKAAKSLTFGDILHDPTVRGATNVLPGSLFLLRFFSQDDRGAVNLNGFDTILNSSAALMNFLERVLPSKTSEYGEVPAMLGFASDIHPLVLLPKVLRRLICTLPTDDDLVETVEFLGSNKVGSLYADLAAVVIQLTPEQRKNFFESQDAVWADSTNIPVELLTKIRERFCDHNWYTFAAYNQALTMLVKERHTKKLDDLPNARWQVAKFLRFAGCPPRTDLLVGRPWNLLEHCKDILCNPENAPLISAIHDLLLKASAGQLFSLKEPSATSNDSLRYNRYISPDSDKTSYRQKLIPDEEEQLNQIGVRVTRFLSDLKTFLVSSSTKRGGWRRTYTRDLASEFNAWCVSNGIPEWLPPDISREEVWTPLEIRGYSLFHSKLLRYVGGRLSFVRKYVGLDSDGTVGKWPDGIEKDVFDLYLFYLELSFLFTLPSAAKGKYVTTDLEKLVNNLVGILLAGDYAKLGDIKEGITSTLGKAIITDDDRQYFTKILTFMQNARVNNSPGKFDEGSILFEGLWKLVESCQQSSNDYPTLLQALFDSAKTIAARLTEERELLTKLKKERDKLVRAHEQLKDKLVRDLLAVTQRYACVNFFVTLFSNRIIQTAIRRYNNLKGVLGHLYRSHLFYLPPSVLDCNPFAEQTSVTLEEIASVMADIDTFSATAARGYTSGSKCRVMPDLSYELPNKKTVKAYLQELAVQHGNREIYYLGRKAANWRLSRFILNCSRAAFSMTQGGQEKGKRGVVTRLYENGYNIQLLRKKFIADANAVDEIIRETLKNDSLSFARWVLSASLSDETKEIVRAQAKKIEARRRAVSDRTRAYRNLHDLAKIVEWPARSKRDSIESYPFRLGQTLNRRKFYSRWKGFAKLVRTAVRTKVAENERTVTLLHITREAKDYTLLYLIPLASLISGCDIDKTSLELTAGFVSQSAIKTVKDIARVLAGDDMVKDTARRLISLYPSYLDYFFANTKRLKEEEKGEEEKNIISPARLVSAVFKALVRDYEDRLSRLSSVTKGNEAKTYRDFISKCAIAIYAHEYIVSNSRIESQEQEDGTVKEAVSPLRLALNNAWLPEDGLSFIALAPAILPRSRFIGRLIDLGHTLLNEPFITDYSLVGPARAAEAHINSSNTKIFSHGRQNMRDVIMVALQVLAALRITAKETKDLPDLLSEFVKRAETWWNYRVLRVHFQWLKEEGVLEEGTPEPVDPKVAAPLSCINPSDFLGDSEKMRENLSRNKKTFPLPLDAGKESIGCITSLADYTRVISGAKGTPIDVLKFTLRGGAFLYADTFQKKYGIPVQEENLFDIPYYVLFGSREPGKDASLDKKRNDIKNNLPKRIDTIREGLGKLEIQRESARVIDYQLAPWVNTLEGLIAKREVIIKYVIEKNRLMRKRLDFESGEGDLTGINKRLIDSGLIPLTTGTSGDASTSAPKGSPADASKGISKDEVGGIKKIWEEMNIFLEEKQNSRSNITQDTKITALDSYLDEMFERPTQSVDGEWRDLKDFASRHKIDESSLPEVKLKEYITIIQRQAKFEQGLPAKVANVIVGQGEEKACLEFLPKIKDALEALPLGITLAGMQVIFPSPYDLITALKKVLDDFFGDVRPMVADAYTQLDIWEDDLSHLQNKIKKRVDLFDERVRAWEILSEDLYFKNFIIMDYFPCYIRLPRSLIKKLRKKNGGARIAHILLLPPTLPHQHVIANVAIKGSQDTVTPIPSFIKELNKLVSASKNTYVIGVDNNRLNCRRMFAFCAVGKNKNLQLLEDKKIPTKDEYAVLVGAYDYTTGRNCPNDRREIDHEVWDNRSGRFLNEKIRRDFLSSFYHKFYNKGDRKYRIPADSSPFKIRSEDHKWTFSDYLAAPGFYWTDNRSKFGRIVRGCARRRSKLDEDTDGKPSPEQEHQRQRLRNEMVCANERATTIRTAVIDYWIRVLCYIILRFNPQGIAYEKLRFNPWGMQGSLGSIVASMVKDFSEVIDKVISWLDRAEISFKCKGQIKSVEASGTSQECVNDDGEKGPVDRRASSDWIWCFIRDRVVDAHITSAGNIGRRHPLFGEKASVKLIRTADSREIQQQIAEFRYKRIIQGFLASRRF